MSDDASTARRLPDQFGGLPPGRRIAGLILATIGLPALTWLLTTIRHDVSLDSMLLIYLLAVVLLVVIGGVFAAVVATTLAFLLVNWYLTPPYHTLRIERNDSVIALVVFVIVAFTVSGTVEVTARVRAAAVRDRAETMLLSRLASAPVTTGSLTDILHDIRLTFGLRSVALLERHNGGERTVSSVGPALVVPATTTVAAAEGLRLVADGPPMFAQDRRLLRSLAAAAARALEAQRLAGEAERPAHAAGRDQGGRLESPPA
jgi:K+-sensing histidine kinase KdpD